ncbi:Hypothetical protein, putative [Bodo saltans]|uniref:Uncharacterized protein n=1 Tax=Bodo saltans TaxID=75058 RepID=A0A0S4JMH2_BODSA|nr:Hypothetical protein, putative [Bodo saltans]|eukprot:CUG91436.1 Hypothetical protein, putative [Bodo saltans]
MSSSATTTDLHAATGTQTQQQPPSASPIQHTNASPSSFTTTSGFRSLQVHYRTSSIPYRMQLQDLYLVPTATAGAPSLSSAAGGDASHTVTATLSSPLLRVAPSLTTAGQHSTTLKYELHDLRCPNCAGSHPVARRAQPLSSATINLDAPALRGRSSSPSPQRQDGAVAAVGGAGGGGEPATMQRCAQCILCPVCRGSVAHRRSYPDKQPAAASQATAAAALVDSGTTIIYCNACHWRTPPLPPPALRSWMASCTHSVVRSACGYQPIVSSLKHSTVPVSLSSSARSNVTRDISDGTIPFTTVRSEKVLQLNAALERETTQLHANNGHTFWAESQQYSLQRLVGQQVVQHTVKELLESHNVVLPPPRGRSIGNNINTGEGGAADAPAPSSSSTGATSATAARRDPTGEIAKVFGGLVVESPAASTVMFYAPDNINGGGGGASASPQGTSVSVGGLHAATDDALQKQQLQEEELRTMPMLRAPLMPRMNVVVAGSHHDPSSGGGGDVHTGALVSALASACDASDGFSGKLFTNALTNPQLSTSLCATRYLPIIVFPANVSRYAKADSVLPLNGNVSSGGSGSGRRLFAMLRLINAEELTSVTILNMSVASTEGCNARLSIPFLTTAGDEAAPPPPPVIVLRHKDATPSSSTTSAAPQQQLGSARYYVDNRVCDDIFTTVTEEDKSTAEQAVPVAGFHMRQGSCIFGLEVTSAANTDLSLPPNSALTIELQITVSVVSAVLHSALRRAFPMPVHGTDGVVISYRTVLTLEKE